MKSEQDQTRSQLALVAALAKNRGELDAATLERLLRLVGALKPIASGAGARPSISASRTTSPSATRRSASANSSMSATRSFSR